MYSLFRRLVGGSRPENRYVSNFLRVQPGNRILDIGCGPADLLADIPYDVEYHGFDTEPKYIEAAKLRYKDRGTFRVQAVAPGAVEGIGNFDLAVATGVVHHLDDSEADSLFAGAAKILRPGARLVTLDGVYVEHQNPIAKLLLKLDRGRHVRTANQYIALAQKHFEIVKPTILHDLLTIPYTHIILEAECPKIAKPE
jgi:cyclopropane fatty-acyl-phospholipid synthase-like methyltransferase